MGVQPGAMSPTPSQIPGMGPDGFGADAALTPGTNYDATGGMSTGAGGGNPGGGSLSYSEGGRAFGQGSPFSGLTGLGNNALGAIAQTGLRGAGMGGPVGLTAPLTMAQMLENALNFAASQFGVGPGVQAPAQEMDPFSAVPDLSPGLNNGINMSATTQFGQNAIGAMGAPGTTGFSSTGVGFGAPGQSANLSIAAPSINANDPTDAGPSGPAGPGPGEGPTGTEGVGSDPSTGDGGGSGGASGSVICTALHDMGLMPDEIYEKDQEFGRRVDPIIYAGYIRWARHIAAAIRAYPILGHMVRPIVMAWAREMAGQSNLVGRVMMLVGMPMCKYLGNNRCLSGAWAS